MVVDVLYNSFSISLPCSAKQQSEMTKFCVVLRTLTTAANFFLFLLCRVNYLYVSVTNTKAYATLLTKHYYISFPF